MKKLTLLLIPALLFSCAEKSNTALTEEQKKNIHDQIQPVIKQIREAALKADSTMMFDAYDNTADFSFVGIPGVVLDYEGFKEMVRQFYNMANSEILSEGTEKYNYISQDLVLWTYLGSIEVIFKNGWKQEVKPFAATFLFKKTEGKWKVIFLQESYSETPQPDVPKTK